MKLNEMMLLANEISSGLVDAENVSMDEINRMKIIHRNWHCSEYNGVTGFVTVVEGRVMTFKSGARDG